MSSTDTEKPDKKSRHKHKTNVGLAENNPCLTEHHASLSCLDKNNYDGKKCERQFANYRACMDFWNKIKLDRQRKGISPFIPPLEERDAIRKEHYGQ